MCVERAISLTPRRCSSWATDFDTAGCPRWRRRAAAENDPASTTSTNAFIAEKRSILILHRNGQHDHSRIRQPISIGNRYNRPIASRSETAQAPPTPWIISFLPLGKSRNSMGTTLPDSAPSQRMCSGDMLCSVSEYWSDIGPSSGRKNANACPCNPRVPYQQHFAQGEVVGSW